MNLSDMNLILLGCVFFLFFVCIILLYFLIKNRRRSDLVIETLTSENTGITKRHKKILTLLNHLTDGLAVFDYDGEAILVNKKAEEILEKDDKSIGFEYFSKYFELDISFEELVYVESSKNRSETVRKGDSVYNIEFVVSFEGTERAKSVIAVIKDCTEQIKLEDMRKDFISNVSHELKTPLTSISSYTEALLDGAMSDFELAERFLNVISDETKRMDRLIRDLLQLSQIDRRDFPLNKRRLSFENIVKSCVEKVRIDAKNHGLSLECYVIGDIPDIYLDEDRIKQVLFNILSNAIKYTPEKGRISVYIGKTFTQVYVKISDTGIGIPREALNRVFERFYRVDKARDRSRGGTGLGLAISREIVEAHGGEILITSEFGVGTEVTVNLPINIKNKVGYNN